MDLVNNTAFPAAVFRQLDRTARLDAVVAMRGTFDVVPGGTLAVSADQEAFQWEDAYEGDPDLVPLMRQGDLVPYKPGTDVTVLADACCPDPAGASAWLCGLRVLAATGAPLLDKQLRVTGPRWWRPRLRPHWRTLLGDREAMPTVLGWDLTAPETARAVALDWRLARGGPLPDEPGAVHLGNPIGVGIVGRAPPAPPFQPVPAPQVEAPDAPLGDWQADPAPAGLGPLSPWWAVRTQHAGSGELVWLDDRRPVLPPDFDERYWQGAPPDQVVTPWLRGTERYELLNLHPDHPRLTGALPGIMPGLMVQRPGQVVERLGLNLDGVHFDLRPDWERVVLTWRIRVPMPDCRAVRLTLTERARLAEGARGITAPVLDGVGA